MSLKVTLTYVDGDHETYYKQKHELLRSDPRSLDPEGSGRQISFLFNDDIGFGDHAPKGGKIEIEGF